MNELSFKTKAYLLAVYLAATAILLWNLAGMRFKEPWMLFILCLTAALTLIVKVEGATNRSHYTISFLVYGFTLASLGTSAALIVIAVSNLVEWIWKRPIWFIQAFNTGCYILVMYVSSLVYHAVNPGGGLNSAPAVLAILLAMGTFTTLNHLMVGTIVWLARGESFDKSGVFDVLPLMIDMTLLCLGASMVIVWNHNPYALALFLLPLYLIYGTLRMPSLERQTETDSKTGLFNSGYFMQQFDSELNRANRFDRPVSVIMADLDLLRNINNTYGHLAGDEVLMGVASILKQQVREYDVVARFGGEEFAILMPETTVDQAFERGEMVRQIIEKAEFTIPTSVTPIKITISLGIAGRERFDQSVREIIHNADTALYHSKLKGRNLTYACANDTYISFLGEQVSNTLQLVGHDSEPPSTQAAASEEDSYKAADARFVQHPGVQPKSVKEEAVEAPAPPVLKTEQKDSTAKVNLYIGFVTFIALLSWGVVSKLSAFRLDHYSPLDWLSLSVFAILVVLTEWFSIELYVKNTTVSTSAVPMLAGTLLFGPLGSLVLSATFAVTALIKYRSPISRFFFNFSNQIIAGMIYTGLIMLTGRPFSSWNVLVQLLLCLIASFVVYASTTALVAAGISLNLGQSGIQLWREQYAWLVTSYIGMGFMAYALIFGHRSDYLLGMFLVVVPLLLLRLSQKQYIDRTRAMVKELREKQQILERASIEINALNSGLLDTLAEIIDVRDPYLYGHSKRVTSYATQIASGLGLHEKQIQLIHKASLLHDIGKLGISTQILSKPSQLTAEEYDIVKGHAALGATLLEKSPSLRPLVPIIRHHHEHFDGKGYPDRLKGNEIPLSARIVTVSDAIEAMAANRPYRKGMAIEKIIDELRKCSGSQFDPLVVETAVNILNASLEASIPEKSASVPSLTAIPSATN
jgi:diguanylate cyclase (GGDEF)-like protein/putative nucleotidyltransferase with HDIG domain